MDSIPRSGTGFLVTEECAVETQRFDWVQVLLLSFMHLGCVAVIWTSWSVTAVTLATLLYALRAFGLTAFYHRYFSHRAFKTTRWMQFAGAVLGCMALQKGPLWWAAHHREHHRKSDHEGDAHSPHQHGFLWSHLCWFLTVENRRVRTEFVRDWLKFPELRWLENNTAWIGVGLATSLYLLGEALAWFAPNLGTNGAQLVVWGFFISTTLLYHATYSVNSLAHLYGSRRFETPDQSRNNWLVALLTLGEGWHNNHHYYPSSARQGFVWWEVDVTYYILRLLERMKLVWALRPVPLSIIEKTAPSHIH